MELRARPTEHFFMAGDVMVRMWQGTIIDERGVASEAIALITAIAVTGQAEAVAENLVSIPPPTAEDAARWASTILAGGPAVGNRPEE